MTMQLPLSLYCDTKKTNMYIFERLEEINIYLSIYLSPSALLECYLSVSPSARLGFPEVTNLTKLDPEYKWFEERYLNYLDLRIF